MRKRWPLYTNTGIHKTLINNTEGLGEELLCIKEQKENNIKEENREQRQTHGQRQGGQRTEVPCAQVTLKMVLAKEEEDEEERETGSLLCPVYPLKKINNC